MAEWLDTLSFLNLPVSLKNNVGDVPRKRSIASTLTTISRFCGL